MSTYLFLIPISLCLGLVGLAAFMWSLRSGQYEDLDGAAERVLLNEDRPIPDRVGGSEDNAGNGNNTEQQRDHAGHHHRRTKGDGEQ